MKKFMVIDDNSEGRALLSRTLLRTFPQAAVTECQDGGTAVELCRENQFDAILLHRAGEMDVLALTVEVRKACANEPILVLSGRELSAEVQAAGATRFLQYDRWLMVGTVVKEMIATPKNGAP